MFGSHGRGNFKTKSQCETYRSARPWFESSKSYCSGFDVPSFQPAKPAPQVQGNAPAAQGPQVQTKAPASGQPDPAEDRKFNEQKGALLRTIRIPDPGDVPQGPSISPSRFVTPDMCRQAERDREKLKETLAGLQERSRSLDSSMRGSDARIYAEKMEKVQAMLGVASRLLDLGAPAIEKGAPAYLKGYRYIQTTLAGVGVGASLSAAEFKQSAMDAADKCNDLLKDIRLDPKAPQDLRVRLESTNRVLSVLNKAVAFELKQRGEDKARDVDALSKDYAKLATDMLSIYYPPALPASVGMDIDESLNKYREAQDMERRLNLLKAAQFNAREYVDVEMRNVQAQLEAVERTVGICHSDKAIPATSGPAPLAKPVPPLK